MGDPRGFTRSRDRFYTAFAGLYDVAVRRLPVWRSWLRHALPHLVGPRILEVSFGTGYLLAASAARFDAHGLEFNRRMIEVTRRNLARGGVAAHLVRGDVGALPYREAAFDSVLSTMAFSGYPDGRRALAEMGRVVRAGGRLVLIDVALPAEGNRLGSLLAQAWRLSGDLIRDVNALLREAGLVVSDAPIGAAGSVHLWVARKPGESEEVN